MPADECPNTLSGSRKTMRSRLIFLVGRFPEEDNILYFRDSTSHRKNYAIPSSEPLFGWSIAAGAGITTDEPLGTSALLAEMPHKKYGQRQSLRVAPNGCRGCWRFQNSICFVEPLQDISQCALFLAAKVEEQPRKLEHVIKCARSVLSKSSTTLDPTSDVSLTIFLMVKVDVILFPASCRPLSGAVQSE